MFARVALELLRDAGQPVKASDVVRSIAEQVDLTPHEASLNASGIPRWETYVRWMSGWAKRVGWVAKKSGTWELTDAGRQALQMAAEDDLDGLLSREYRRELKSASPDAPRTDPKSALLQQALGLLEEGTWTTYGDLAEVTGLANQGVGSMAVVDTHPAWHRVLQADGRVSPKFTWADPTRNDDPQALLESEGLEFDGHGRANPAQRLGAHELRELLDELSNDQSGARAWLVRGNNVGGTNLIPDWLAAGFCSLQLLPSVTLRLPLTKAEIADTVDEQYAQKSYATRSEKLKELDVFLNRMRPDDLVATVSEGSLYVGRVVGPPAFARTPGDLSNLRRPVEWLNNVAPAEFTALPKPLATRLASQHTIVDLTSELTYVEALIAREEVVPEPAVAHTLGPLPKATAELATELLVSETWMQECIDLLADRKQLIFYGPPGTGKTFLARAIARHITAAENVKLVQFHPSYSYEDFFEGYRPARPTEGSTTVGFELTPGPFRRLVDKARDNPATPYVLIIDEINRANLAKVFGELYFLLEYREEAIDLLYASGDEEGFSLPENVFIIGTMNTADRSIALVDSAMRRRFAFTPLHPSQEPTSGMLTRWLERKELPLDTAVILARLNDLIDDDDFKIGPSYFMRPSVHLDGGLERMWRTAILPLLEEHHFGDGMRVATRYSLGAIQGHVQQQVTRPLVGSETADPVTDEPDQR